jgi:hypothetical protein
MSKYVLHLSAHAKCVACLSYLLKTKITMQSYLRHVKWFCLTYLPCVLEIV